jgi:hypothetical protein
VTQDKAPQIIQEDTNRYSDMIRQMADLEPPAHDDRAYLSKTRLPRMDPPGSWNNNAEKPMQSRNHLWWTLDNATQLSSSRSPQDCSLIPPAARALVAAATLSLETKLFATLALPLNYLLFFNQVN